MNTLRIDDAPSYAEIAWTPFSGGELEGTRTTALCPSCRAARRAGRPIATGAGTLCFQCYRTELERNRQAKAAVELNTASDERFQTQLPFEPVNVSRLTQLRVERQASREHARHGAGGYVEKRRRAQIEARHALARIFTGLKHRELVAPVACAGLATAAHTPTAAHRAGQTGPHTAGTSALQFPDSWLPFVVSR